MIWLWLLACGGPRPQVSMTPPDRDVAPVFAEHLDELQDCYEDHRGDGRPHGIVHLVFDVVGGRAKYARIEEDTTSTPHLAACMRDRIGQWWFELPDETYQQTLTLKPPKRRGE